MDNKINQTDPGSILAISKKDVGTNSGEQVNVTPTKKQLQQWQRINNDRLDLETKDMNSLYGVGSATELDGTPNEGQDVGVK